MASLRFRLRQRYWRWTAPGKIRGYMRDHSPRKLQIGAGDNLLPGWLNTTLYPFAPGAVFLDARLPFPIPDAQFDYVFSEHVIEHLEFDEAAHMLAEARRILRPGGRLRIATPDLAQIIALYTQPCAEAQQAYIRWIMDTFRPAVGEYNPAHVINQSFHGWRHKFIYDEPTLIKRLEPRPDSSKSSAPRPVAAGTRTCVASSSMDKPSAARKPCATRRWCSRRLLPVQTKPTCPTTGSALAWRCACASAFHQRDCGRCRWLR